VILRKDDHPDTSHAVSGERPDTIAADIAANLTR
jgi:hypothetical protein